MSSEEYLLMAEILKKIEDRFKMVTEKQAELKRKIDQKIEQTSKLKNVDELKISII